MTGRAGARGGRPPGGGRALLPSSLGPPEIPLAGSIDEVIDHLSTVIDWARDTPSRLGYFAALYRKVTVQVREGIRSGYFDDGPRMERFDVNFANRYLQALIDLRDAGEPSRVWSYAFDSTDHYWPIVLQHLLLGMNAHINLDLGIAAAQTMRGQPLEGLRGDFDKINAVLASLVDDVQDQLAEVWLTLRLFNALLGSVDDTLVGFSMEKARDEAWRSATNFWSIPERDWPAAIERQDTRVMALARLVRHPGVVLGSVTRLVRLGEVQDITRVIDILA